MSPFGLRPLATALLLAAAACGQDSGSGGATTTGSCTVADYFACIEWVPTSAGNVQTACAYTHGTYSTGTCPAQDRIGHCAFDYGSYTMTVAYYPGAGTADELRTACEQANGPGGVVTVWTPG